MKNKKCGGDKAETRKVLDVDILLGVRRRRDTNAKRAPKV